MLTPFRSLCIFLTLSLMGCQSTGSQTSWASSANASAAALSPTVMHSLASAQLNTGPEGIPAHPALLYLAIADQLVHAGLSAQAENFLIHSANAKLSSTQLALKDLLTAEIAWQQHKPSHAFKLLKQVSVQKLPTTHLDRYQQLSAQLLAAMDKKSDSAEQLLQRDTSLFSLAAWSSLQGLPNERIERLSTKASNYMKPWYSLLKLSRQTENFEQSLTRWQQRWPRHSAQQLVSTAFVAQPSPLHISVLLPSSGPYADQANIIREGIMAAYYDRALPEQTIHFFDTNDKSIIKLYEKAVSAGSDLVIGPLLKPALDRLVSAYPKALPVPVIALNISNSRHHPTGLYQLSLRPEDELEALAKLLIEKGHRRVGIMVPDHAHGLRLEKAFSEYWRTPERQLVVTRFDTANDPAVYVRQLFEINNSQARLKQIRQLLMRSIQAQPRRRSDLDALVLLSDETVARQIRPLFDFYFAEDLPVYSTSMLYAATADPKKDRDLNDVYFCDLPWLLDPNYTFNHLRPDFQSYHPTASGEDYRLFALGLDALSLATGLDRISQYPELGFPGATGILRLHANGHVIRQPVWARMEQGRPVLIQG